MTGLSNVKRPCIGCKYFDVCGDSERTRPCSGREPVFGKMSYKHFLLSRRKPDSKEQFASYLWMFDGSYRVMSLPMQKKYVDMNFKYRFIEHAWM